MSSPLPDKTMVLPDTDMVPTAWSVLCDVQPMRDNLLRNVYCTTTGQWVTYCSQGGYWLKQSPDSPAWDCRFANAQELKPRAVYASLDSSQL